MAGEGQNIIEVGFNVEEFTAEQKQVYSSLSQFYELAKQVNGLRIAPGSDNSYSQLNANTAQFAKTTTEMIATLKAAEAQFKSTYTAQKDYAKMQVDSSAADTAATKTKKEKTAADYQAAEATRQHTAEMKNQAKQALASAGSLDAMKASLAALTAQRSALPNAGSGADYDTLTQKIKILTQTISQEEQKVGDFRRNVGNYTGAIDTLKGSLAAVTENIQRLTAAGQQDSEMMAKLVSEQSLLTELVGQQSAGFTSLSREVMSTGKALETMAAQGLEGTEAFKSLEQQFITGKRELREFRNEQTLLASESPKISALTIAAKGLAGAYATGAGVASLFADGNEKIAKDLNQLVAIMTILQGLEEFNTFLREKSAIATAIFGTETVIATTAVEAEAVAMDEAAASTTAFSAALEFLEANPIILVLTALAAVLVYVVENMKDANKELIAANELYKEWADNINANNALLEEESRILNESTEATKRNYKAKLELAQIKGDTPENILAIKKQIVDLDAKEADAALAADKAKNGTLDDERKKLIELQIKKQALLDDDKRALDNVKKIGANPGVFDQGLGGPGSNARDDKKFYEDKIKDNADLEKSIDETSASIQKTLDTRDKNEKKSFDAHLEQQKNAAEVDKLTYEQRKKLFLAAAEIELKTEQEKNGLILSNDASTYAQRIAATKRNTQALIAYAAAQRDVVLGRKGKNGIEADPNNDETSVKLSWSTFNKSAGSATTSGDEETRKLNEEEQKRRLTAQQANNAALLSMDSKLQEDIYKDQQNGFGERIQALANYNLDQRRLVLDDAAFQKATKNLTNEELITLQTETDNKLKELAIKNAKEVSDIAVQSEEDLRKKIDLADQTALSKKEAADFAKSKNNKDYERQKKIDEDNAKNAKLQDDLVSAKNDANNPLLTPDAKAAANDKVTGIENQIRDNDTQTDVDNRSKLTEKEKAQITEVKDLSIDAVNVVENIQNAAFEKQLNRLEKEAATVEKNEQRKVAAINNSTLNAQQKAIALQETEAAAAAQKAVIERQEKATEIAKAKFDRDAGIAKIIINTAVGATKAYAELGPLGGTVGAALVIAAGAVELAAALATPIPKYAEGAGVNGRPLHPGGLAIFGEAGAEQVHEPGKTPYIAYEPTLASLAAGTKITPLMEGNNMNDYLLHKSYQSMNIEANKPMDEKALINGIVEGFGNHIYKVTNALKNQKAPIVINKLDGGFGNYINIAAKS